MEKKLTRVGNSLALLLDKPILEILGITHETVLSVTTDGHRLIVSKGDGGMAMPTGSLVQMNILDALNDGGYHDLGCSSASGWPARFGSRSENLIAEQIWHLIATGSITLDPESKKLRPLVERMRKSGPLPPAAPSEFIDSLREGVTSARITGPGTDRLLKLKRLAGGDVIAVG